MEILEFRDAAAWEAWLSAHHDIADEAWLRIGKRHAGRELLPITDALDGALCYGWIDSVRRRGDDTSFLQRYSPRRYTSGFSDINRAHVERLAAAGRMRPPGWAALQASDRTPS